MRAMLWLVPALVAMGLVLAVPSGQARAADEGKDAGKGTIAGSVVDKDGKAVAGAQVRVMKPMQRGEGGGRRGAAAGGAGGAQPKAEGEKPAPGAAGPGGGRGGNRPPPVAQGETDKDGKFSLKDIPAGDYMVMAMVRGKGMGRANVTVKAGETATVALTLQEMPAGGGRRGGAGGAGGAGAGGGAK